MQLNDIHQNILTKSVDYEIVSFDVFDTLVYRRFLMLNEIQQLSAKFLKQYLNNKFIDVPGLIFQRRHITQILKSSISLNTQEPTLHEVFDRMLSGNQLNDDEFKNVVNSCVEFEHNLELNNIFSITGSNELLANLKKNNKKIIAISDMYFTYEHVSEILEKNNLMQYIDTLYVSSNQKKTKQTQDLFRNVLEDLKVNPSHVLHIGDNYKSDVINARAVGIDAIRFPQHSIKPLSQESAKDKDLLSIFAKLSICFVINLVLTCREYNINKIFFLSRDATIFHAISEVIKSKNSLFKSLLSDIEIQELHLSRTTTAFLDLSPENTFSQILDIFLWLSNGSFKLVELFDFFELNIGDFQIQNELLDLVVNKTSIKSFKNELCEVQPEFKKKLISAAFAHRDNTVQYLRQEGVLGNGKVALVDLGYTSTSTRQIATYLNKEADNNLRSNTIINDFLFIEGPSRDRNFNFSRPYTQHYHNAMIKFENIPLILRGNFSWIECLFSDNSRGPLLKYKKSSNDEFVGDFKPSQKQPNEMLIEKVSEICSEFEEEKGGLFYSWEYSQLLTSTMLKLMSLPDRKTIEIIADFKQSIGAREKNIEGIIKDDFGIRDLYYSNYKKNIANEVWYTGSIVKSGKKHLIPVFYMLKVGLLLVKKMTSIFKGLKLHSQEMVKKYL